MSHRGQRHARKIARIVRQLRTQRGSRFVSLRKKAVAHQVPKRNDRRCADDKIDISDLDEILDIDVGRMTCTAEPGVTFEALVAATLPLGLAPIIVPELRTITIGGAVSGCSVESMSFAHGGFHDTCIEYEVITARGEVLLCAPDNENQLIFQMAHGSFGTLGILSCLTFRLVRARPFVRMRYESYRTLSEYTRAIWRHFVDRDVDFMDGIVHSPSHYVLSLGRYCEDAPYTNRYDWMKVYYRSTARRREDYLATPDYFFRYDNGVTNPFPRSALGRLLVGKFIHSSQLLRIAERLRRILPDQRPDVTLDVFIPFSRVEPFMEWYCEQVGHFPLWCVPYRLPRVYEWIRPEYFAGVGDELFLDLAIYGMKQGDRNIYKLIEDQLPSVRGIKTLIAYNYYEPEAFWAIWNRDSYAKVKRVVDPDNLFRDLYEKTCRAAQGLEESATARAVAV